MPYNVYQVFLFHRQPLLLFSSPTRQRFLPLFSDRLGQPWPQQWAVARYVFPSPPRYARLHTHRAQGSAFPLVSTLVDFHRLFSPKKTHALIALSFRARVIFCVDLTRNLSRSAVDLPTFF